MSPQKEEDRQVIDQSRREKKHNPTRQKEQGKKIKMKLKTDPSLKRKRTRNEKKRKG